jgi:hypothetical protein
VTAAYEPRDATLADVTAAHEDLGDAHWLDTEMGDHAAEWRAQRDLDATVARVASRSDAYRAETEKEAGQ